MAREFRTYFELLELYGEAESFPENAIVEVKKDGKLHWTFHHKDGWCFNVTSIDEAQGSCAIRYEQLRNIIRGTNARFTWFNETALTLLPPPSFPLPCISSLDERIALTRENVVNQTQLPYSLTNCNCEHYVTWIKYGRPFGF